MATVSSEKAKRHLLQLLERVAKGEKITITERGVPVAMLVPARTARPEIEEAVRKLMEFRSGRKLGDLTIREMIEEGRRY